MIISEQQLLKLCQIALDSLHFSDEGHVSFRIDDDGRAQLINDIVDQQSTKLFSVINGNKEDAT